VSLHVNRPDRAQIGISPRYYIATTPPQQHMVTATRPAPTYLPNLKMYQYVHTVQEIYTTMATSILATRNHRHRRQ
jgi:hypothetical protein